VGYVTRSRGITIHRRDCYNIINEDEKERLIQVEWGQTEAQYPVSIQVDAWDRVGLLRDISSLIAAEKVNMTSVEFVNHDDHTSTALLKLETTGLPQLSPSYRETRRSARCNQCNQGGGRNGADHLLTSKEKMLIKNKEGNT